MKTYNELILLPTFEERLAYLQTHSRVGNDTFGGLRYLNQRLYAGSLEWRIARRKAIVRDSMLGVGCGDMGLTDYPIGGRIIVHHITPITPEDIYSGSELLFSLNNLICVSEDTHSAIHYGTEAINNKTPVVRSPNDTIPWR